MEYYARLLVFIGALNWGLISLMGEKGDVVSMLGDVVGDSDVMDKRGRMFDRAIYFLVGFSAVYLAMYMKKK